MRSGKPWHDVVARLLLILIFTAAVSSCTPRQSESTVTIGVIAPQSGEFAALGEDAINGVRLAVDELNSTTGLVLAGRRLRVALRIESDRGEAVPAEAAVKKLKDANVAAIVGPFQPETAASAAAEANRLSIPLIVPTVGDPNLTMSRSLVFRACFDDRLAGEAMAVYAMRSLHARRAAVLFDSTTPYNATLATSFGARFGSLGGMVVAQEAFADERVTSDFRAVLQRILAANPDVLFSPNYYRATAAVATQARELGLRVPILSGEGVNSPDFPLIGGEAVEGTAFPAHFARDDSRPTVVRFRARYRSTYQHEPDAFAALAYDAARLLLATLRLAGSTDPSAIRSALLQTQNFPGVTGTMTYAGSQSPRKGVAIIRVKNGAFAFETTVSP